MKRLSDLRQTVLRKTITLADMPNLDMRLVAERCGVDVAVTLLEQLPGVAISVPKNGFRKMRDLHIIKNFNGRNAKDLAVACGLTERQVYNLVQQARQVVDDSTGRGEQGSFLAGEEGG